MKKSLIALAVAGAFAAPSAMAIEFTPTMYQSVALSIGSYEAGGVPVGNPGGGDVANGPDGQTLVTGGGRSIGFKATEDLGNGMTAGLFMHFTADVTSGHKTSVVHRNGYVSLGGNFGTIKMGTNEHVFEVGMIIDGWGSDWAGGNSVGGWDGAPTRIGRSFNWTRQDINSIWWTSPNWNGFVVDAAYIMGPGATSGSPNFDAEGIQAAVKWSNGPLAVHGALANYSEYASQENDLGDFTGSTTCAVASDCVDADGLRFTVEYDFGVVYVGGTYSMLESTQPGTKLETTTLALTAIMPVASGRIIFNYALADDQDLNGAAIADSDASGFDIGYQHDLSSAVYAFARYQSNESGVGYDSDGLKEEFDAIMVGLKVSY